MPDEIKFPIAIELVKTSQGIFVATSKTGTVMYYKDIARGVREIEQLYNTWHQRSYEASMSACINNMQFQPGFVEVQSMEEIGALLGPPPYERLSIRSVAGGMTGLLCKSADILERFDKSVHPRLISEQTV